MPTSPGVVFSLRFVQAAAAQDQYSRYAVGYLSRPQAFEGYGHENDPLYHDADPRKDQYGYMSNEDKTDGLFDFEKDLVNDYGKMLHAKIFDFSQQQDCPLYQGVISFRNDFLQRHHINYTSPEGLKQLKEIARLGISDMIHESHIQEDNVDWTAAIHTNTDNIHIHFAIVELQKVERTYDMLEVKAFDQLKSRVANRIVGDEEKKDLSQILQLDLPHGIRDALQCTHTLLERLADTLPDNIPWQYNRPEMARYHDMIDACVDNVVASNKSLTDLWERGKSALHKYDALVREMYGNAEHTSVYDKATGTWGITDKRTRGLAEEAAQNKLRDYYARAGNALLREAKVYRNEHSSPLRERDADAAAPRPAGEKSVTDFDPVPDISLDETQIPDEESFSGPPEDMIPGEAPARPAGEKSVTDFELFPDISLDETYIPDEEYFSGPSEDVLPRTAAARPAGGKSERSSAHGNHTEPKTSRDEPLLDDVKTSYNKEKLIARAERNDPYAQYQLGKMYLTGKGVERNQHFAAELLKTSADQGNSFAAYELAKLYRDGIGVEQNDVLTELYFYHAFIGFQEKESITGSPQMEYRLGNMYLYGEGCPIDSEKAVMYLQAAANKGHSYAQYTLGKLYLQGKVIEKNISKACSLLADAGSNGNQLAQFALAQLYLDGSEVEQNLPLAFMLMKSVADQGNAYAAVQMFRLYRDDVGTKQDMNLALTYRAAAKNIFQSRQPDDMPEMVDGHYAAWTKEYREAKRYFSGSAETKRDFDMAMVLLEVESERGNAFATYDLAHMYMEGLSVDVDQEKAGKLYSEALQALLIIESAKHDSYIQYRIGKMYRDGQGTEKDLPRAAEWFQQSADQENQYAEYALGNMYYHGEGVGQDYAAAIEYYGLSANQDNTFAQYALGMMYRDGIGTEKDEEKADKLLACAFKGFVELEEDTKDDKIEYRIGRMLESGIGTEINRTAAVTYYEKAAGLGNSYAMYALAKIYLAEGDDQNIQKALSWLEKSAKNENPFAQYALAKMYLSGENLEKNVPKAVELFQASAAQDNSVAQYALAKLYLAGEDLNRDVPQAVQLLKTSADLKNQYAQYTLGKLYLAGEDIDKNDVEAFRLIKAAADQGNAYASYTLSKLYREGIGTIKNTNEADRYITAAFSGFSEIEKQSHDDGVQQLLANMLMKGEGCERDVDKAVEFYQRSADQNNQFAQYALGKLFLAGEIVDKNDIEAFRLIKAAADQGNVYAFRTLSKLYREGVGTEKNTNEADRYIVAAFSGFSEMEKQNHDDGVQLLLANMLMNGEGCERDVDKAVEFYQRSADQNNQFAQYALGKLYFTGEVIEKDIPEAVTLLTSSAGQNNPYAQYMLGKIYLAGEYVAPNQARGFRLIKAAADQGNAYAAYTTAELYRDGIGAEKNEKESVRFFCAAYSEFTEIEHKTHDDSVQLRLANMLMAGEGCDRSVGKAIDYYMQSAGQNNQFAQYTLGRLYLDGKEVMRNYPMAMQLLKSSAGQGNQFAQYALGQQYRQEGKNQKALQFFRFSAAQGNTYAKEAISRINHPAGRRKVNTTLSPMRALASVNYATRRLTREYERNVDNLIREYDYEQSLEQTQSRSV